MRAPTLMLVLAIGCVPKPPGESLVGPSVDKCQAKGCDWSVAKAERLDWCREHITGDVIRGAECMGRYIRYFGTKPCKDTRAWLARLRAGIPEDV